MLSFIEIRPLGAARHMCEIYAYRYNACLPFFRILALAHRSHRSTDFHAQWLIRRGFVSGRALRGLNTYKIFQGSHFPKKP